MSAYSPARSGVEALSLLALRYGAYAPAPPRRWIGHERRDSPKRLRLSLQVGRALVDDDRKTHPPASSPRRPDFGSGGVSFLVGLIGALCGALLTYFLDPDQGRRRRRSALGLFGNPDPRSEPLESPSVRPSVAPPSTASPQPVGVMASVAGASAIAGDAPATSPDRRQSREEVADRSSAFQSPRRNDRHHGAHGCPGQGAERRPGALGCRRWPGAAGPVPADAPSVGLGLAAVRRGGRHRCCRRGSDRPPHPAHRRKPWPHRRRRKRSRFGLAWAWHLRVWVSWPWAWPPRWSSPNGLLG